MPSTTPAPSPYAPITTTTATTTTTTTTTTASSTADTADFSCPHCPRTFTSRIGLVGHLRIHRTESGEPVPGAATYTHQARLNCPHCPRTFRHRMGLFGRMRIHDDLWYTTADYTTNPHTPYPPPPSPTHITNHPPHAPNCHLPRKWEVCTSTRSPCGFCCTGDLSPRLSRHVKRHG
nr:unnamed protein product [Spirometra erinaceieuropaei]